MPKPEKIHKVEELTKKIGEAKSILVTDYKGLNVEEISDLRSQLREAAVEYTVVKNTLAKISSEKLGLDEIAHYLDGPTAIALGSKDPLASIRIIHEYQRKKDKPVIKAYMFEGQVFLGSEIKELANLPSREVLLARLLGTMSAPISKVVFSLNNLLQKMVYVLDAIKGKQEQNITEE